MPKAPGTVARLFGPSHNEEFVRLLIRLADIYDVQPVDPLDLWSKPPFDPVIENGRVYARGAADDKSHVHMHLWAARAWLETQGRLPVNLRIVFEGRGGVRLGPFRAWIEANRDRLTADLS